MEPLTAYLPFRSKRRRCARLRSPETVFTQRERTGVDEIEAHREECECLRPRGGRLW